MSGWRAHLLGSFLAAATLAGLAWGETLEMVTYYPAPAAAGGDFDRLHANRATIGADYNRANVPDADVPDGQLFVFDRVGIGTTIPEGPLHVVGVDDTVSNLLFMPGADTAAPGTPGLRVGIGVRDPTTLLTVGGQITQRTAADVNHRIGLINTASNRRWNLYQLASTDATPNGFLLEYFDGVAFQRRLTVDQAGNVGIGTNAPGSPLYVASAVDTVSAEVVSENRGVQEPGFQTRKARRAADGSPLPVQAGGSLGIFSLGGFDGSGYPRGAAITGEVRGSGAWSPGDTPARLRFHTTPDGSTGPVDRMVITEDGNVGIGTTVPQAPAPNAQPGNLDANDVWLRSANGGAGAWVSTGAGGWEGVQVGSTQTTTSDSLALILSNFAGATYVRVRFTQRKNVTWWVRSSIVFRDGSGNAVHHSQEEHYVPAGQDMTTVDVLIPRRATRLELGSVQANRQTLEARFYR